ncbi:MAG: undecaprenyldiphospho-muramoylpentapeptide beta-N-acetylglucosaminyltransferase [Cytophagales bacterium]|nr:undecaprenyldiphospho-muramoylpentapeptide beta-N-acetylglucosaminyltransferase [Cytophagales bacterium]
MGIARPYRIIISGGGTGGHIYPAVAIANYLKEHLDDPEILFVGAKDRMEMEKVPKAGYKIVGLDIAGLQRRLTYKNLLLPFKLIKSLLEARKIIKEFNPDIAIGVGGYASGPLLFVASSMGKPCLIQEQNSYAGITNKLLANRVRKICVAYTGMDKYFPKNKLVLTGNPVRKDIVNADLLKLPGSVHFKLSTERKTILVIGGSLGARTINESIADGMEKLQAGGYQLIWQTGKSFFPKATELYKTKPMSNGWGDFKIHEFIYEMNLAYGAADVIISRAGALSISELCLVGKPVILVPSPNVSEDHQTKNAMALVSKNAAILVKDVEAKEKLIDTVIDLLNDEERQNQLKKNILALAKPHATEQIGKEIVEILNLKN